MTSPANKRNRLKPKTNPMKNIQSKLATLRGVALMRSQVLPALIAVLNLLPTGRATAQTPAKTSEAIPWSQIGAKAGADYQGDGLVVLFTAEGARLSCVFQRLEGEATRKGLWLTSTVTNAANDRFRVVAAAVRREVVSVERGASEDVERGSVERGALVRRSDALTLYAPLPP